MAGEFLKDKRLTVITHSRNFGSQAAFKSGMELTLKQLSSAFEKFNIKEINPVGEKFDAHKHQAIGMLESEQEPNTVVSVMQKGYALHDRVLRPALVMVAKAKE